MDPNTNPNTAATWQLFTMIAVAAAVFGATIGLATAKPPPKLPACSADAGRRVGQAGYAAENDDLTVFGLHSIREVSSIANGTELRHCTAIAITDQGERTLRFVVGWIDQADEISYWARPKAEQWTEASGKLQSHGQRSVDCAGCPERQGVPSNHRLCRK